MFNPLRQLGMSAGFWARLLGGAALLSLLWPTTAGLSFNCPGGTMPAIGSPFGYTGSVTTPSVPAHDTLVTIDARGGDGGDGSADGGSGAEVAATVPVASGTTLYILVGQVGASTTDTTGGGGGSFVATGADFGATDGPAGDLLIAAGGGGGGSNNLGSGGKAPTGAGALGASAGGNGGASGGGGGGGSFSAATPSTVTGGTSGGGGENNGSVMICYAASAVPTLSRLGQGMLGTLPVIVFIALHRRSDPIDQA